MGVFSAENILWNTVPFRRAMDRLPAQGPFTAPPFGERTVLTSLAAAAPLSAEDLSPAPKEWRYKVGRILAQYAKQKHLIKKDGKTLFAFFPDEAGVCQVTIPYEKDIGQLSQDIRNILKRSKKIVEDTDRLTTANVVSCTLTAMFALTPDDADAQARVFQRLFSGILDETEAGETQRRAAAAQADDSAAGDRKTERLLFGSSNSRTIVSSPWFRSVCREAAVLRTQLNDGMLDSGLINGVVPRIRREMTELPLISDYRKRPEQLAALAKLLVSGIHIEYEHTSDVKIFFDPMISAIERKLQAFANAVCRETANLTVPECLETLTGYAVEAGNHPKPHMFTPHSADAALFSSIDDGNDVIERLFLKNNEIRYRFRLKQYRLYLCAAQLVRGVRAGGFSGKALFAALCGAWLPKAPATVLTNSDYDEFVIMATAAVLQLDAAKQEDFYTFLTKQALDSHLSVRKEQIAAICTISHILSENLSMTSALRDAMFRAAFGRATYSLQVRELPSILGHSKYYADAIRHAFEHLGDTDEHGFLVNEPLFFFFCHIPPRPDDAYGYAQVLHDAAALRSSIWEAKNRLRATAQPKKAENETPFDERIKQLFRREEELLCSMPGCAFVQQDRRFDVRAADSIPKERMGDCAYVAYAIQATAYAMHNAIQTGIFDERKTKSILQSSNAISLLIFSDHFLRRYTKAYSAFCRHAVLDDISAEERRAFFLPCGAFRLTSALAGAKGSYIPETPVALSEAQARHYRLCLEAERGRFHILLRRMLLCTDYHTKWFPKDGLPGPVKQLLLEEEGACLTGLFLPYDNMTAKQIKALPENKAPVQKRDR